MGSTLDAFTFGCESKNGQIKHLFHGKTSIFQQLLFNVDILLTLQLVRHHLSTSQVANFIGQVSHTAPRNNMKLISDDCYFIGAPHFITLSSVQKEALQTGDDKYMIFSRVYKSGIVYHSTFYTRNNHSPKRENTYCSFISGDGIGYGQIELFVAEPEPQALYYIVYLLLSMNHRHCCPYTMM